MDFRFDRSLAEGYKSRLQQIRGMSESWVADNVYCPVCGDSRLMSLRNNRPVADFQCESCGEVFELKSKNGSIGRKISDGAYETMIDRITGAENPDLFVMQYTSNLEVMNLTIIPKFFFTPDVIEKRPPLAQSARRAGWVGCNILYSDIPRQGRISVIRQQQFLDKSEVVDAYKQIKKLQTDNMESRGWLLDVLNCVNNIEKQEFTLSGVYEYSELLKSKHLGNNNVEAKIRQQLQLLRDKGFIEFLGHGHYRKLV